VKPLPRIVTIIGTDGSGKTTVGDSVANSLRAQGAQTARLWLGSESYLMAPVRAIYRLLHRGVAPPSLQHLQPSYADEVSRKTALVSRAPWLARPYVALALFDYRVQLRLKLLRARRHRLIIADRYVFDVAINIGLALGWEPSKVIDLLHRTLPTMPLPALGIFLRVPPETSLARKSDIPDETYLALRMRFYDAVAAAFGFHVLDGTRPVSEITAQVLDLTQRLGSQRYVHFVHANNTDIGGADKVLATMAARTRFGLTTPSLPSAYRVAVSLRRPTSVLDSYHETGTPVLIHPFLRPQTSTGLLGAIHFVLAAPGSFVRFVRLFRREKPDVVHTNDLYDFIPALAARVLMIPVVSHVRMIRRDLVGRILGRRLVSISTSTICVSEAVRTAIAPAPRLTSRVHVIRDYGNLALMTLSTTTAACLPALPTRGRLVLMVGRVEPWKGQQIFLEAVSQLPRNVVRNNVFALVGGPVPDREAYFAEVRSRAEQIGVMVLGPRSDVPDLLRQADISVHCSVAPDPFPGVVIESLLAGAATIASADGGVPEMINSSDVGLTFPPSNARHLAMLLEELLTNDLPPRTRFAQAARERALALVDSDRIDQELGDVYDAAHSRNALTQTNVS
jgi:glycosyltransferase involved in cell wall biosynthesis